MTTNLTRLTDSGFILESDGKTIVFDVGEYCDDRLLAGREFDAAVFSHLHRDHCDVSKLPTTSITMVGPSDMEDMVMHGGATAFVPLIPGKVVGIEGFTIEPLIVDHGNISVPIENYGLVITTPSGECLWFAGDIRVDSEDRPTGKFDLIIVPIGGEYVLDADEALTYLLGFPGEFMALGVHYDYAIEQAARFAEKASDRINALVLAAGETLRVGGN